MDKFFSYFQSEKRKTGKIDEDTEARPDIPATEDRRKWSISRSGRMKQANKKRHSVVRDLYGEACAPVEKPTSVEYHVNGPVKSMDTPKKDFERSPSEPKSPEEEIESAFEILEKVDTLEKAS